MTSLSCCDPFYVKFLKFSRLGMKGIERILMNGSVFLHISLLFTIGTRFKTARDRENCIAFKARFCASKSYEINYTRDFQGSFQSFEHF